MLFLIEHLSSYPGSGYATDPRTVTYVQASKLLRRLDETTADATFPDKLRVIFDQFSNRVSCELGQINQLFVEYTPHDDIHMQSLLRIADHLLGDDASARLNGCEACVLACAIYGHDWGMAVSQDEKALIVTGKLPGERGEADFALLPDEQARWQRFARSAGIGYGTDRQVEEESVISKEQWREYVRKTHADRARARAIHYFKNKGDLEKLGMPVGEVCAGHWYNMAQIRTLYTSWSVGGHSINLRALAIYMRFIDLLDIGDNRTPFTLWKYINPRNAVSSTEWKKHRAVSPVTYRLAAPGSGSVRVLQVHGHTEDNSVYPALQDLKRYMEDQIRENVAALQDLGSYSLGVISLEWNVEARGFEPIDIRFEFDRSSMFDLVSGEIYDGDPYVFIRELLQNAIDASELRRRRFAEEGLSLEDTAIRISVDHQPNGDAEVIVTDRGTGMDLGIVCDYLAVIGRSYYRSREFDELETGMTPISRFGVGLLSCFEVADSISLTTRTTSNPCGLAVDIADRSQQFRVSRLSGAIPVGTSVKIWVKASKWRRDEFSDCNHLLVTDYVKAIAGFVPFPIHIREAGTETVVCPALTSDVDVNSIRCQFPTAAIHRQPGAYGLDAAVVPQDHEAAPHILIPERHCFTRDIGRVRLNGVIDYFKPNDRVLSSTRNVIGGHGATFCLQGVSGETPLRWTPSKRKRASGVSPSAHASELSQLYVRGILIPDAKLELPSAGGVPPARIVADIQGDADEVVPSLSRRDLRSPIAVVGEEIEKEIYSEVRRRYLDEFCGAPPLDRLMLLGRLARYVMPPTHLLHCLPIEKWPVTLLNEKGALSVTEFDRLPGEIEIAPKYYFQKEKKIGGPWGWCTNAITTRTLAGASQIVRQDKTMVVVDFGFEYDDGSAMEWNELAHCLALSIRKGYRRKEIRLGLVDSEPYMVERLEIGENEKAPTRELRLSIAGSVEFSPFESTFLHLLCLMRLQNNQLFRNRIHILMFNSWHPASVVLKRALDVANDRLGTLDPVATGRISDAFAKQGIIGSMQTYQPGVFEPMVTRWVRDFCFAVAEAGIMKLTGEDRAVLKGLSASSVMPCLE